MSLHYHSATIPPLMATADEIRAAAKLFNHDFPEALTEIDAGIPIIDMRGDTTDAYGRRCRVSVAAGLIAPDGGFIYAHEPYVLVFQSQDGRVAPQAQAARMLKNHLKKVQVSVRQIRR